jgi:hypothetical protein
MSLFMEELLDIAKKIIPEADYTEIENNIIRLSWKTNDDPKRPNKRLQPVIIEIQNDYLTPSGINSSKFPDNVSSKIRKEFAAFIRDKRAQFTPRTTKDNQESHTPDYWVFSPEA